MKLIYAQSPNGHSVNIDDDIDYAITGVKGDVLLEATGETKHDAIAQALKGLEEIESRIGGYRESVNAL